METVVNKRDLREMRDTQDGALVIASRRTGNEWLVTATASDTALTQVQGIAFKNDAGFRGRQWEFSLDGQQHPTLKSTMETALAEARSHRVNRLLAAATRWQKAERASEARYGAAELRRGQSLDNAAYWAAKFAQGVYVQRHGTVYDAPGPLRLPEAAFDWPIYRAAFAAQSK